MTRFIGVKNGNLDEYSNDLVEIEDYVHDVNNINEPSEVIRIESDDENIDPMNNVETSLFENEEVNFGSREDGNNHNLANIGAKSSRRTWESCVWKWGTCSNKKHDQERHKRKIISF